MGHLTLDRPAWPSAWHRAGVIVAVIAALIAASIASPRQAVAAGGGVQGDRLVAGQILHAGDYLQSLTFPNHTRYELFMQGDGNLVFQPFSQHPLGISRTSGHPGAFAIMQGDGNLVVYTGAWQPLWWSGTNGHPGAFAIMQGDGNFVVYSGAWQPLWWSGTASALPRSGDHYSIAPYLVNVPRNDLSRHIAWGHADPATGRSYPYWYTAGGHPFYMLSDQDALDTNWPSGDWVMVPRDPRYLGATNGRWAWRLIGPDGQLSDHLGIDINSYELVDTNYRDHLVVLQGALIGMGACAGVNNILPWPIPKPITAPAIAWCGVGGAIIAFKG